MSKAKKRITNDMFEPSENGEAKDMQLMDPEKVQEPASPAPDETEAQRVLAESRQRRASACFEAIQKLLQEHNCEIIVVQMFVNGQPRPTEIQIAAR